MSKLLDKEFYSIRTELYKVLFPKGEDAYSLHEILVMDKIMSLIAWENRGLDVFEYYYKERVIFPDGGIYFFGRKYFIDEDRLIDILINVLDRFRLIMDEIPDIKAVINETYEDLHEEYLSNNARKESVKLKSFAFVDGFILYDGYVCPHPSAKRGYSYISISEKKEVDILLGNNGRFEFFNEKDKINLLKSYKLTGATKVIVDVNDILFENGSVSFNPIPSQRIFIKTRVKLPYSKAIYNQYKGNATMRSVTVVVSGGKVTDFANSSIIDCIKTIRKVIYRNKYVKALPKVDSLTSIFNNEEITSIFEGDATMTKSIKKFRTALGQKVKEKRHDLSEAIKAIKKEADLCHGNISCIVSCRNKFCKYDVCFKIMLSHLQKYPVLLVDEPYEYGNGYKYVKNMVITTKHLFSSDNVYIIIKAINESECEVLQFTVSRHNYYKALFMIYTYFGSKMPEKRIGDNCLKYLKPFGIVSMDVY